MPRTAPANRLASVLSLRPPPPACPQPPALPLSRVRRVAPVDEAVEGGRDDDADSPESVAGPPTVPLPVGRVAAGRRRRWFGRSDRTPARVLRLDPGRPGAVALVLVAAVAAVVAAIGVWTARPQAEPVRGLPPVAVDESPGASGTAQAAEAGAAAAAACGVPPEARTGGAAGVGGGGGGAACDGVRAAGSGAAGTARTAGAAAAAGAGGAAGTAGGTPGVLVVSVAGRVAHPGVVRVPDGARVADALAAVGGARPGVDLSGLNLARRLVDGEQIAVGVPPAPDAAGQPPSGGASPAGEAAVGERPGAGPAAKIDLNTASVAQLDTLPGVGPVTAQHIVEWRGRNGPFARVDQLREIDGIGERRFQQLRELVTV